MELSDLMYKWAGHIQYLASREQDESEKLRMCLVIGVLMALSGALRAGRESEQRLANAVDGYVIGELAPVKAPRPEDNRN